MSAGNPSSIVKDKKRQFASQNQKGFRFWRIQMPMRRDVRPAQHHIEKAVRIVLQRRMKIVVDAPPGRLAGLREHPLEERAIDQLHAPTVFHSARRAANGSARVARTAGDAAAARQTNNRTTLATI